MKTVLIVDADLGFAFWLGQGLDEAGYHAFPAKSIADATALPDELKAAVDLVIVDPALSGAAEFIETFRRCHEGVKVVGLRGDRPQSPATPARIDLWCRKPERMQPYERLRWIERVEELLPVNLFQKKPRGNALGNLLPFEMLSGWLWERLSGSSGPSTLAAEAGDSDRLDEPAPDPGRTVVWKEWEGQVIDGQFELQRHLGGAEESAVFLTQVGGPAPRNAAIKLVLAGSATTGTILSRWERAAELSHPGLLQMFQTGSCRFGETELAYLVMEYAEESVAEVLRERPLTAGEAREMLDPVLAALESIHENGFVHGRLKPSNILAVGNQVKIASDGLRPAFEPFSGPAKPGVYDPPESPDGAVSAAGDVWSLGVTLVEALTLQRPILEGPKGHRTILPESLPPAFREIALHCLRPDPLQRDTVAEIASRLHGGSPTPESLSGRTPRMPFLRWVYAVAAATAAVALSAMLTRPEAPPARPATESVSSGLSAPSAPAKVLDSPAARPIVEQILPDVAVAARGTLHGTLLVTVSVQVDSSGHVVSAHLVSPGPSHYFAGRALEAAQRWRFAALAAPASRPEEWVLRFRYSAKATQAVALPARP